MGPGKILFAFLVASFYHFGSMHPTKSSEAVENKSVDANFDVMQSDQPQDPSPYGLPPYNLTSNVSNADYIINMRERMKQTWLEIIKQNILNHTGHRDTHTPKLNDTTTWGRLNYPGVIKNIQNEESIAKMNTQVTEKIRSYYPSCDSPRNTDEELWANDTSLNLYFNISTEDSLKSASSFLRLYRLVDENATNGQRSDERLLRVSVYWYLKPLRKNNRAKKRLSDSKMVSVSAQWVELNIRPALDDWSKGRNKNLGLNIIVEDQDDNILKPIDFFKGPSCMVGISTPKPIPAVVLDAFRRSQELNRLNGILEENSTSTFGTDIPLLPAIDICYIEYPENYSKLENQTDLSTNACSLMQTKQNHHPEKYHTLPNTPIHRHIRHSHHFMHRGVEDPRSRIQNSTLLIRHDELLNWNLTNSNR